MPNTGRSCRSGVTPSCACWSTTRRRPPRPRPTSSSAGSTAAATYIFALGVLGNEKAYNAVASVMPVEAQHAIALGFVLGKPLDDKSFMPSFETANGALDPAKFPVA